MNRWSLFDRAAALIPFQMAGYTGQVAVYYGANDDPVRSGFDALVGLGFDYNLCRGYPVIHARIEEYAGSGYRTLCGWIQLLTSVYTDSHDPAAPPVKTAVGVDLAPSFYAADMPYCSYGNLPQVFGAPCYNLGPHAQLRWTADTFLTTVPARSREEGIAWLLGFRWGYVETDIPGQAPVLLPPEVTGAAAWNGHLATLRQAYGMWKFREA